VSCPHAHQQNGAIECKHHHIVEVGLALLSHASMSLKYWDEVFLTPAYLINHLPSKVIDNLTPLECLLNQKLNYSALHTFGCACWPYLRPYNSHKLQFMSKQCVFLGYNDLHKGYKCLDVSFGRIYISRDVIFDEEVFPFSNLHPNAGAHLRSEIALLHQTLIPSNVVTGVGQEVKLFTNVPPDTTNISSECENQDQNSAGLRQEVVVSENGMTPIQERQESALDLQPVSTPGIVSASGVCATSAPGPVQPPGARATPASPLGRREENLPPDSSQHGGGGGKWIFCGSTRCNTT
jgi:hypothetical protein